MKGPPMTNGSSHLVLGHKVVSLLIPFGLNVLATGGTLAVQNQAEVARFLLLSQVLTLTLRSGLVQGENLFCAHDQLKLEDVLNLA